MKSPAIAFLAFLAFCLSVHAASPVAKGFPGWEGVVERNYIHGRMISSSDLRHKAAMVIEIENDDGFMKSLEAVSNFYFMLPKVDGHISWDLLSDEDFPRGKILLVSLFGRRWDPARLRELRNDKSVGSKFLRHKVPFYYKACPAGADDGKGPKKKRPYGYVFSPDGEKPLWEGTLDAAGIAAAVEACEAAEKKTIRWKPLTGIEDLSKLPAVEKHIKAGKMKPALAAAEAAIKSKDPEISRQGQIVYDAIEQFKSDLVHRIGLEAYVAPARAYADMKRLVRLFPAERKNIAEFERALARDRQVVVLGKMMEKVLLIKSPGYAPKPDQVKKDIQLVKRWKRMLKPMSEDKNTRIAGQAMLLMSLLDEVEAEAAAKLPAGK